MDESEKKQTLRKRPGRVELISWAASAIIILTILAANGAALTDCAVVVVGIAVFLLARSCGRVVWMCVVAIACVGVGLRMATLHLYGDDRAQNEITLDWTSLVFWGLPVGVAFGLIARRIAGLDHRWFQFRLRTLLIAVFALSVLLSAYFAITQQARRQREAIMAIRARGGYVCYEWENVDTDAPRGHEPAPSWSRDLLGNDYFDKVVKVGFGRSLHDDDCLKHLVVLTDLESLSLYGTQITGSGLGYLGERPNLRVLLLSDSQISDASLEHVKGFTSLQELLLERTKVSDAGLVYLAGLTDLRRLDLSDTLITDCGMKHLEALTSLRFLNLTNTRITDAGLERLKGLRNLLWLDLSGTAVTEDGVTSLKKSLPRCSIGFMPMIPRAMNQQQPQPNNGSRSGADTGIDSAMEHLGELNNLHRLNLADTHITDAGMKHVSQLDLYVR